jgi:hypothetical protein
MDTRSADYEAIQKGLNSRNPEERRQATMAKERISAESSQTRAAREELAQAHMYRDRGKIEELHHKLKDEGEDIKRKVEAHYGR